VDHWSFWKNLGLCSRTFLSILVVTMGQWVPTQTAQFSCLLARCFGSSLWCELVHSSYRRVYSAKVANPYMGARSTQRQRRPLLPPVLAWRDWPLERILPLNYKFLGLDCCVPNTVSYRTKTGHTRKKELILTRDGSTNSLPGVWKRLNRIEAIGNIEVITWTKLWSTEQNAVQIISLMFVNDK
jgi:hypothetical protein